MRLFVDGPGLTLQRFRAGTPLAGKPLRRSV